MTSFSEILENKSKYSLQRFLPLTGKTSGVFSIPVFLLICLHGTGFFQSETAGVSCDFRFSQEIFTRVHANREYSVSFGSLIHLQTIEQKPQTLSRCIIFSRHC